MLKPNITRSLPQTLRSLMWWLIFSCLGIALLVACAPTPEKSVGTTNNSALGDQVFITSDEEALPFRYWPAKPNPVRAVLVVLHGFNDYSNSFANMGEYFAKQHHITTYAYDQRGFGGAEKRGTWAGTQIYVQDLRDYCALIRQRHPGIPLYVMGESMGGAIAMVAFTSNQPPDADGVILSAPAVWARPTMPWYQRAALFVGARLFPWMSLTGGGIEITVSDNIDMLRELGKDPLVIKATKVGAMYGLTNLMDEALASTSQFTQPSLIMVGDLDEIVPNHASAVMLRDLPKEAKAKQKVVVYDQGYHMLTRDLQGQLVIDDVLAWINNPQQNLPSAEDQFDLNGWVQENLP